LLLSSWKKTFLFRKNIIHKIKKEGIVLKKRLKSVTCAVAAILLLSVTVHSPVLGPFSVDVVSAATGDTAQTTPDAKAPAGATFILQVGSNGTSVEFLQTKLNNYGYGLKVDGIFGNLTLNAVKDYQAKNGLTVDGIVGPKTYEKLNPETPEPVEPATPVETPEPVEPTTPVETPAPVEPPAQTEQPDVVTTASIVNSADAFEKAISKDGTWIIATLNDLTINKELVLEGEFRDKNLPEKDLKRKIGLYTQDEKHVVIDRFTLTAPKLTIKSPKATLQHGIFVGDIYVRSAGFSLVDQKVEGNVYFVTQEAKDTFTMDDKSAITGSQILADVDVVATASIVDDAAAFEKAISKDGAWIICPLRDLTTDKDLVVEGEFRKKNLPENDLYRKIGLYTHNDPTDKKIVTHRFTLTAPSLTIKSPNTSLQHGIFVGDIYVRAAGFELADQKVEGNVYFVTQEAKDTFTMDEASSITGSQILADVDVVATASIVDDAAAFEKAISKDGAWIICPLRDLTIDKELVVEGEFRNKNLPENDLYRKIGLYTHNDPSDKKIVTHRFTLTAPKLTIKSPNTSLQHGIFVGDIYVESTGFALADQKVEGNVYFATQEAKDTFTMDEASSVTGVQELKTN